MSAAEIAAAFKLRRSGRQWRGPCPVHGGTKDPFALTEGIDGALLVFCHAGCERVAILAEIRRRAGQWSRLGAPVRLLDAAETARRVGTGAYRGALLDLRAGTIQPLAYARGLADAALRRGARIHTASPVSSWRRAGGDWLLETASGARVAARRVLLATNAYTGRNGQWRALRAELAAFPYFNLATAPLRPDLRAAGSARSRL